MDPDDPDSACIPLVADLDRVTPEGRVRVSSSRDSGASWFTAATKPPPVHSVRMA